MNSAVLRRSRRCHCFSGRIFVGRAAPAGALLFARLLNMFRAARVIEVDQQPIGTGGRGNVRTWARTEFPSFFASIST